jgi:hypothetical protein
MNRSLRANGIAVLLLALLAGCGRHATSTSAAQDEALTALKSLRASGVLSEAEYQSKLATLQGTGSAGLGDSGGVGEIAAAPDATRALGMPGDGAAGLPAGGNEFAASPPVRRAHKANAHSPAAQNTLPAPQNTLSAAQNSLPAANNWPATQADSQPDARAGAQQNGSAHVNPMRSFLSHARAAQEAMARSAHDLALKIRDGASHANSSTGQQAITNQGAQALGSTGQEFMGGDPNANPRGGADQASGSPPQR